MNRTQKDKLMTYFGSFVPSPILPVKDIVGIGLWVVLVLFTLFGYLPYGLVVVINASKLALVNSK